MKPFDSGAYKIDFNGRDRTSGYWFTNRISWSLSSEPESWYSVATSIVKANIRDRAVGNLWQRFSRITWSKLQNNFDIHCIDTFSDWSAGSLRWTAYIQGKPSMIRFNQRYLAFQSRDEGPQIPVVISKYFISRRVKFRFKEFCTIQPKLKCGDEQN